MLTTARRRVIAASASVLLFLGLGVLTTSPSQADDSLHYVSGQVNAPPYNAGLADVAVRFYRATGNADDPWSLQVTTYTHGGTHGGSEGSDGQYETQLPSGTYRVTYNEFDDGGPVWDAWAPATYVDSEAYGHSSEFEITDHNRGLADVVLDYRGGLITGTVTDQCGADVAASVAEYDANDAAPQLSLTTGGSTDGTYSIHSLIGPSKLQFRACGYENQWLGAATFSDATSISAEPGASSTGHDIVLNRILQTTGTTPSLDGRVVTPEGTGIPGVTVRFYQPSGGNGSPWVQVDSTTTIESGNNVGRFNKTLPVGAYRMTINEPDGSPASNAWLPDYGPTGTSISTSKLFCLEGNHSIGFFDTHLNYRGGLIKGRVTDARGKPVKGVKVEAYDAADVSTDSVPQPSLVTTTDAEGAYTTHGVPDQTKLRFSDSGAHVAEWLDDASTFADATVVSSPDGQESTGHDVVLADGPIVNIKAPTVKGRNSYRSTLSTTGGTWNFPVHKTYRWYRTSHGVRRPISHATSSKYKVHESDIGTEISVRVTARALTSYPGVASRNAYSAPSDRILRDSSTRISSTFGYSHGTMTVHITVKMTGVKHPKGTLHISYYNLKYARGHWVYAGHSHNRTMSFKDGKVTLKAKMKGVVAVVASYRGTSTIRGSGDSRQTTRSLK